MNKNIGKKSYLVVLICTFILAISKLSFAEEVYQYVEPNGSIMLTDDPEKEANKVEFEDNTFGSQGADREDVQQILKESQNIYQNPNNNQNTKNENNKNEPQKTSKDFSILYPTDDAYIRNGLGELLVKTDAKIGDDEALKASIDGTLSETMYDNTSFLLTGIERGDHTIIVSLVNKSSGNVIATSQPVNFFMYRNIILQNRPQGPSGTGP